MAYKNKIVIVIATTLRAEFLLKKKIDASNTFLAQNCNPCPSHYFGRKKENYCLSFLAYFSYTIFFHKPFFHKIF